MKKPVCKLPLSLKITLFVLFSFASLLYASNNYAQRTMLNISSQTRTVSEVLTEIEKQTDFTAAHITGVNIQYVPGEDLKTIFGTLEFQPVASRAAQAAALRAEKEGKTVADLLKSKNEPEV